MLGVAGSPEDSAVMWRYDNTKIFDGIRNALDYFKAQHLYRYDTREQLDPADYVRSFRQFKCDFYLIEDD
jgi:hypothetical protein